MARAHEDSGSLRFSRREGTWLTAAVLLSLLLHLAIWCGYLAGNKLGWWDYLRSHSLFAFKLPNKLPPIDTSKNEEPTTFVDVSHADADAPEKTKYYSDKSSRAANPVEAHEKVPIITGRRTVMPKTEDVPKLVKRTEEAKPQVSNLQPSPPSPSKPEMPQTPGETEPVKKQTPERPRTLKEALASRAQLPGEAMQQAGGVSRHAQFTALDVKSTPFGDYDRAIIEAVTQRWYDLLDQHRYADDRTGKVTLQFKLRSDGTVIEMHTLDNTVGDLLSYLCQESIEEAAPFAKWPPDMVRMVGENYREVTFTFYYY